MKVQITNTKSQILNNFKFLNSKPLVFENLNLIVIWNLIIDACSFVVAK